MEKRAEFYERRFGGALKAFEKEPLCPRAKEHPQEALLRVMVLPSFSDASLMRIELSDADLLHYDFKELEGPLTLGQQRLGQSLIDKKLPAELRGVLEKIAPFSETTLSELSHPDFMCMDGTRFVFEFAKAGSYRAITRHSCELIEGDDFSALLDLLGEISKASGVH